MSCYSCWPPTPPERSSGWGGEMRHSVLWGKTLNRPSDRYFPEKIFWAQFLHLLRARKVPKSFMVTSVPCVQQKPSAKISAWVHVHPFTKITCLLTLPYTPSEQFLRAIWGVVSWTIVLTVPPINRNLQLPCCAFFQLTKPRRESSEETNPTDNLISEFYLHYCERINLKPRNPWYFIKAAWAKNWFKQIQAYFYLEVGCPGLIIRNPEHPFPFSFSS